MASILSDSDGDDAGGLFPLFSDSDGDDAGGLSPRDLERPTKRRRASPTGERVVEQQPEDIFVSGGGCVDDILSDAGDDVSDILGDVDNCEDDIDHEVEFGGLPPVTISSGTAMGLRELRPFQWALGVLRCLEYFLGAEVLRGSLLLGGFSFATHFSGVGTAERSLQCLMAASPSRFAVSASLLWSCEKRLGSWRKLLCLPGDSCVFSDILDISPEGASLYNRLKDTGEQLNFDQEWKKLCAGGLSPAGPMCQAHGGKCFQQCGRPDVDISGSPCQAWASLGKREGDRSHLTILFLVWAQWVRAACPLVLIHENVRGFRIDLFETVLGDLYEIVSLAVEPSHVAFPCVRRPRLYFVLFRKGEVKVVAALPPLYHQVSGALESLVPALQLSDIAIASREQLVAAENAARRLRHLPALQEPSGDWEYLLSDGQKRRLRQYIEALPSAEKGADHVFDLVMDPVKFGGRRSMSALPTLQTNSNRMWMQRLRRWFLPVELAYAHGFPVVPHAARDAGVEDFDSYSVRDVGEGMHMANVGAVLAIALSCVQRK